MKWCNYDKHFVELIQFKGKDGYCRKCRKEYTRLYREATEEKTTTAKIYGIEVDILCKYCGNVFQISIEKEQEAGTWTCPHCDNEWSGTIKARLKS